jgi:hypothetical protein
MDTIKCTKCKEHKTKEMFPKRNGTKKGIKSNCKVCEYKRQKEWKLKNKERLTEYKRNWKIAKKSTDPFFKFNNNVRKNIQLSFKRGKNQFKKNAKAETILGCTIQEFTAYIQSKFTEGMTLENHGVCGWHLDHIIPVSSAKNEEELIKLNHYTNFQPLWAIDNIIKSNKI